MAKDVKTKKPVTPPTKGDLPKVEPGKDFTKPVVPAEDLKIEKKAKKDKDQPTQDQEGHMILRPGAHQLNKAIYNVHDLHMELEGKVFVAAKNVNWIPVFKCGSCKETRPEPMRIFQQDGKTIIVGKCANTKTCQYHGSYIWVLDYPIILG